jgi:hypothetical protein
VAKYLESGLKATDSTHDEWPDTMWMSSAFSLHTHHRTRTCTRQVVSERYFIALWSLRVRTRRKC